MKKALIVICLLMLPLGLMSKENASRRLTYGVEWSYIASFHCGIHHNFFSQEGYRVDLNHQGFDFESNGEVNLHCGFNIKENWNISLHSGIVGIYDIGTDDSVTVNRNIEGMIGAIVIDDCIFEFYRKRRISFFDC